MGLVDYAGSDSEDEDVEMESKPKEEDEFFGESSSSKPLELNKNDVLEDIVKPKNWEIKLAEKQKRKLEKKAAKKAAKKEAKKIAKISKPVAKKIQIQAFGALANTEYSDSDEEEEEEVEKPKNHHAASGFLSFLPAPKGKNNVLSTTTATSKCLVPPSVAKKTAPLNTTPATVPAPRFIDSDEDDNEETTDFFGFSSKQQNNTEEFYEDIPTSSSAVDVVGPSKPSGDEYVHPSQMYNYAGVDEEEEEPQLKRGKITDEQAHKLLMRFSHDIGPEEKRSIDEMANSIVDVNVDEAIGPDVKSNILKNLGHRAFAESTSAPLPQAPSGGQVARRRNQITYLANLAVSREEALKDKWASQKQQKQMARQKYGF